MKKTLSFLLALTILLGVLPFSAAAKTTINEVHISVDTPKKVSAYSNIPTVPEEYRKQYKIAEWFWYNETTSKKLAAGEYFNIFDTYSLNLVLHSTAAYEFANNGSAHSFATIADGVPAEKYSVVTAKEAQSALGEAADVKITFVSNRDVPEIRISGIPTVSEGGVNKYDLSYGTYVTKISDYDNGTTIKNGVMWEDITDPDNEVTMNIGDKFRGTHTYRITAYFKTLDTFKYNIATDKTFVSGCKLEMLDLDGEGYVTRFKITHEYSAIPHENHNWVQTTVKRATFNEDGLKSNECSICGACAADTVIPRITEFNHSKENFIYYKNNYYSLKYYFFANSSNSYAHRTLICGEDYDVKLIGTGQITYDRYSISLKGLALGTHTLKIIFKGDYSGTLERKITVSLGKPKPERLAGKTAIKLSWNAIDGATYYRVFEKNIKTGKVKCLASKVTGTAFVVKNKSMGTKYKFAVRAYRTTKAGKTYCSDYEFKDYYTRCGAPTILKAKVSGNKVTLTYTKVKGASSYSVYKYNAGKEVYEYFKGYTKGNTYTFSAIKGTYYFKVAANDSYNGTVASNFSKPVKVRVK